MLSYCTMQAGKLVLSGDTILVKHKVACIFLTPLSDGGTTIMTNVYILGLWTDLCQAVQAAQTGEDRSQWSTWSILAKLRGTNYLLSISYICNDYSPCFTSVEKGKSYYPGISSGLDCFQ